MSRDEIVVGARDAIQNGSKSFRAASRLFDRTTRERAWMLYAWCRHCDDVCDGQVFGFGRGETGDVSALRDKTHRTVAGEELDELPFKALGQLLRERPIPERFLDDHLKGFELDQGVWQPADEPEMIRYCYYVAGAVGCMMAIVMGVPADDEETLGYAADLGIAFQLSNIARDIREDHDAGRYYMPAEWLDEFGVEPQALFEPRNAEALAMIARRLVDRVEHYEARARLGVGRLPFRSRLAVLSALRIYGAIGRRVAELGYAAWDERVTIGKARKLAFVVPSFAEAIGAGRR
jgi:phytoene synthase